MKALCWGLGVVLCDGNNTMKERRSENMEENTIERVSDTENATL